MEIEKSNVNIKLTLVIKYISMAVLIGIIVGIVDTIFGRGLLAISDFRTANYKISDTFFANSRFVYCLDVFIF